MCVKWEVVILCRSADGKLRVAPALVAALVPRRLSALTPGATRSHGRGGKALTPTVRGSAAPILRSRERERLIGTGACNQHEGECRVERRQ